jgi:predicted transcriptional regulator
MDLKELKVAVINHDIKKLEELSREDAFYKDITEAKEMLVYIRKAIEMLLKEKTKTLQKMQEIKKLQKFTKQNTQNICDFTS